MEDTTEEKRPESGVEETQEGYVPRPAWQVWGARAAFVQFFILVISQILSIARGGL